MQWGMCGGVGPLFPLWDSGIALRSAGLGCQHPPSSPVTLTHIYPLNMCSGQASSVLRGSLPPTVPPFCWLLHFMLCLAELCSNVLPLCMSASSWGKPQIPCFILGPAPFGSSWVKHYCMYRKTAKKFNMIPFEHRSGGKLVSTFCIFMRDPCWVCHFISFILTLEKSGFRIKIFVLFLNCTPGSLQLVFKTEIIVLWGKVIRALSCRDSSITCIYVGGPACSHVVYSQSSETGGEVTIQLGTSFSHCSLFS